jgi:hypothetical protein
VLNWARATLGTFPVVTLGSVLYGPAGVIGANLAGASVFALAGAWLCRRLIAEKALKHASETG